MWPVLKRQIFIIGNGEVPRDFSGEVDACDLVIRFNEPKRSLGMTGTRTDFLFVNGCDLPMEKRLGDPGYWRSPIVEAAGEVILNYNRWTLWRYGVPFRKRLTGRRRYDWTKPALSAFRKAGKSARCLTTKEYESARSELIAVGARRSEVRPSTGYLGMSYFFSKESRPGDRITVCGFSFEGWEGHQWDLERRWLYACRDRYDIDIVHT